MEVHQTHSEPWKVTLLDTGVETMTGGRLLRAKHHIGDDDFCFTYGDGVADVDVRDVIAAHDASDALLTRHRRAAPGALRHAVDRRRSRRVQREARGQRRLGQRWLLRRSTPRSLDYIEDDTTVFERGPLERLAAAGELGAFQHHGFWHGMDTLWDKIYLNELWDENKAPVEALGRLTRAARLGRGGLVVEHGRVEHEHAVGTAVRVVLAR